MTNRVAIVRQPLPGKVVGLLIAGAGYSDPDGHLVVASDTANIGDIWDGKAFVPLAPAAPTPAQLAVYAGLVQAARRDGGITVDVGTADAPVMVDVASDAAGRGLVSGCVQLAGLSQGVDPPPSFPWINDDGARLSLTSAQIRTLGLALGTFVQATYATLGDVLAAVAAGTLATEADVDAAAWPSRTVPSKTAPAKGA